MLPVYKRHKHEKKFRIRRRSERMVGGAYSVTICKRLEIVWMSPHMVSFNTTVRCRYSEWRVATLALERVKIRKSQSGVWRRSTKCPTWISEICYDVIRLWYNGYEEKYNASGTDIARKKFPLWNILILLARSSVGGSAWLLIRRSWVRVSPSQLNEEILH